MLTLSKGNYCCPLKVFDRQEIRAAILETVVSMPTESKTTDERTYDKYQKGEKKK